MKITPLAAVAALFAAALCAFAPGLATAQTRDNVYVVSGVYVDQTAANAAAAQQAGLAAAHQRGFERLVRRLTLPEDLVARGMPVADAAAIERLVLSVDVQEERRSGTRYIGRLTLRFDPTGVRTLLRQHGLTVVDTRTSPVLVAAIVGDGVTPETAAVWREVWANSGYGDELVPLTVAPEGLRGPASWQTAQPFAQAAGATSVIFATLRVQGGTVVSSLVEVDANARRERADVASRIDGDNGLRAALASLAEQANTRVQNEWRARLATGAGQRERVSASALYANQAQWEQIKDALEGAAATIISEIRIQAVGREGALVSFSYVGERTQLITELTRRGVSVQDTPQGVVLRVAR
jgi:hypothetical protein